MAGELSPSPIPSTTAAASKQTVAEWLNTVDIEKAPWLKRWFWFAVGGGLIVLIAFIAVVVSSGSQPMYYPAQAQYSAPTLTQTSQ